MSARAALRPFAGAAGYVTAKAAVIAFVQALDADYRSQGVRANAILPSVIDTPANRASMPESAWARLVPPARITEVVLWLCSPESAALNGVELSV